MKKWTGQHFLIFAIGVLWGAAIVAIAGILFLRSFLIVEYPMNAGFDTVERRLPEVVKNVSGWSVQNVVCSLPKPADGSKLHVFRLCQANYAKTMLDSSPDRKTSAIIPCAFALYEKDGKTVLARLNVNLMGRLLGGETDRMFHEKIAKEQDFMIERLQEVKD